MGGLAWDVLLYAMSRVFYVPMSLEDAPKRFPVAFSAPIEVCAYAIEDDVLLNYEVDAWVAPNQFEGDGMPARPLVV